MREWMVTPSVMIDERRLKHNIQHMQTIASTHNVRLRPHVKTHKCVEITQLQLASGAQGITVSKPSEALKFFHSGALTKSIKSILLAYPVISINKLTKLLVAAQQFNVELHLTVDSVQGLDAVEKASISCDVNVTILLHIDVGYHRVGLEEDDPRLVEFATRIQKARNLGFGGLLSHAGQAYACHTADECAHVAEQERLTLLRIRDKLQGAGVPVPSVSVGSTLTELSRRNFEGITEIRPGNYVFMDRTPLRMGLIALQDVALTVLTTVVSVNKHHIIIDAGSKVLSSDLPRANSTNGFGNQCFGLAFYEKDFELVHGPEPTSHHWKNKNNQPIECFEITKLSEEHGWIAQLDGRTAPAIGQRLIVVPNHSCVVTNLTDMLFVQGDHAKSWKVYSRGCTQ